MTHCTVVMHTETRTQQGVLSYVLLNVQGGVCAKADVLAPLIYHDIVCLTETWLIEYDAQLVVPHFTYRQGTKTAG